MNVHNSLGFIDGAETYICFEKLNVRMREEAIFVQTIPGLHLNLTRAVWSQFYEVIALPLS